MGVRGNHLFPQEKYRLNYNLYFYSFPSLYWGRGYDNGANSDNESDYKRFQAQVKVDFMFRVAKSFYIGPMAVFDYIDGRDFEKPELWEVMSARTTNTSLGLSLLYDSRDFLTNAYQGYYLRIDQRFSPAFLGNKYAFSSTELTTSYYHPVWKGGVLAGQFHTLLNYGNPPWGLMATLGSSYSMRGYYEGRYRDKCAMDAQIELRQHVWKRNGVAVWAGAGTVFPRFSDFTPKHLYRPLAQTGRYRLVQSNQRRSVCVRKAAVRFREDISYLPFCAETERIEDILPATVIRLLPS